MTGTWVLPPGVWVLAQGVWVLALGTWALATGTRARPRRAPKHYGAGYALRSEFGPICPEMTLLCKPNSLRKA